MSIIVYFFPVKKAVEMINEAVDRHDEPKLMAVMTSPEAALSSVDPENRSWYMQNLVDEKALKAEVFRLDVWAIV